MIIKSNQIKSNQIKSNQIIFFKRALAIVLLFACLFSSLPVTVCANEDLLTYKDTNGVTWNYYTKEIDGVEYAVNVYASNVENPDGSLVIPEILKRYPVYSVGDGTNPMTPENIIDVTFSSNVKIINANAFKNKSKLDTLFFADNTTLTTVGDFAFFGTKLSEVILPDTVKSIGESAFEECNNLTKVYLSKHITSVGINAFKNCPKLAKAELNANITYSKVFTDDPALVDIVVGENVTAIAGDIFYITHRDYINPVGKDRNVYFLNPETKINVITTSEDFNFNKSYDTSVTTKSISANVSGVKPKDVVTFGNSTSNSTITGTYDGDAASFSTSADIAAKTDNSKIAITANKTNGIKNTYALGSAHIVDNPLISLSLNTLSDRTCSITPKYNVYSSGVSTSSNGGGGGANYIGGYLFTALSGRKYQERFPTDWENTQTKNINILNYTPQTILLSDIPTKYNISNLLQVKNTVQTSAYYQKVSYSFSSNPGGSSYTYEPKSSTETSITFTLPDTQITNSVFDTTTLRNDIQTILDNNQNITSSGNMNIYTTNDSAVLLSHVDNSATDYVYPDTLAKKSVSASAVKNGGVSTCNLKDIDAEDVTIPYVVPKISYNICFDKNY